ncbi:MAG: CBS domain-containing protein [Gammaproteobacteria bacterium]|nr:CBS domain-containing protein [Gammaproteobacteria bacterium]
MSDHPSWFERLSHFLSREPHSQKQLIDILRDAEHRQLIDHDALKMIEGVLAVSDKKVRDIMIPRPQMVVINGSAHPTDVMSTIIQSQHSRFPVMGEKPDKILGILLAKDLLPFCMPGKSEARIRDLIRPVVFIPESKPLDLLLKEFRSSRNHMAIVVDEYGGVSGLVTIEDVLEEIVGDIEDEYDVDETELVVKEIEKNIFMVNALTPIENFNRYFKTNFNNTDFDTIGGLIVQEFGYLPKRDEMIIFGDFEVQIVKATRRGIQSLQFKRI